MYVPAFCTLPDKSQQVVEIYGLRDEVVAARQPGRGDEIFGALCGDGDDGPAADALDAADDAGGREAVGKDTSKLVIERYLPET